MRILVAGLTSGAGGPSDPCNGSNLEVHHREFRSHSGADSEENLITLCARHATPECIAADPKPFPAVLQTLL